MNELNARLVNEQQKADRQTAINEQIAYQMREMQKELKVELLLKPHFARPSSTRWSLKTCQFTFHYNSRISWCFNIFFTDGNGNEHYTEQL